MFREACVDKRKGVGGGRRGGGIYEWEIV